MIFPDLSVAENIFIGHRDRGRIVDRRTMRKEARRGPRAPWRQPRRRRAGSRPDAGRAADRRDRQGHLAQCARPHHGRADRLAVRARGRPAVRHHRSPASRGRRHPLHLPPHGGGVRDRRPGHDPARRTLDLDSPRCRADPSERHPRHGRPRGRGALQATPSRIRARSCSRSQGLGHERVRSRTSSSSFTRARCSASRAWSARAGPMSGLALFGIAPADARHDHARRPAGPRPNPREAMRLRHRLRTEDRRQTRSDLPAVDRRQHHRCRRCPASSTGSGWSASARSGRTAARAIASG